MGQTEGEGVGEGMNVAATKELVILRMGPLLSPPISVPRGTQQWRIGIHSMRSFSSIEEMRGHAPREMGAVFTQQSPEYLQIGEFLYRVLDYVV